jgi:nucleotide-binding universal stress UspA family protein
MLIRQILVPLDGTMRAHMALPHAAALARSTASRLVLLHVSPPLTDNLVAWGPKAWLLTLPPLPHMVLLAAACETSAETKYQH